MLLPQLTPPRLILLQRIALQVESRKLAVEFRYHALTVEELSPRELHLRRLSVLCALVFGCMDPAVRIKGENFKDTLLIENAWTRP